MKISRAAISRLNLLMAVYGADADLTARRAIALIGAGRTQHAAKLLTRAINARNPGLLVETRLLTEGSSLRLEVELLEMKTSAVPVAEARTPGAVIYLSETDWKPGMTPAVDQVVSDHSIVTKLVNWEIAQTRPDVIRNAKTGTRYRIHRRQKDLQVQTAGSGLPVRLSRIWQAQGPCRSEAERGQRKDCSEEVYLVQARLR